MKKNFLPLPQTKREVYSAAHTDLAHIGKPYSKISINFNKI